MASQGDNTISSHMAQLIVCLLIQVQLQEMLGNIPCSPADLSRCMPQQAFLPLCSVYGFKRPVTAQEIVRVLQLLETSL